MGAICSNLFFNVFYNGGEVYPASSYFISSSGNDNNDGRTVDTPWQTLSKVNSTLFNAGDYILFKRGDSWQGTLIMVRNGLSGNPITYGAYGNGEKPLITGFSNISSWTNMGNNIWESTNTVSLLDYCNMVSIENINTPMGSIPKVFESAAINLALNKTVIASSYESNDFLPNYVVDGNGNSRWSTGPFDNQWIYVDLGSVQTIEQIKLSWEAAYASAYRIEVSNNLSSWTQIYTTSSNTGGTNNLLNLGTSGRYVRMTAITRATEYGVSLYEFAIYDQDVEFADNIWFTSNGYYTISSHVGMTSLTSNYLTGTPNWNGAQAITRSNNWTYQGAFINSHIGDTLTFSSNLEMIDNFGFFIQNDIRCCTQQNDWYYNPTTHKISIYSTSQPSNVKIANVENIIDLAASYITIRDLSFIGSNGSLLLSRWPNSHISVLNCNISFAGIDAMVFGDNMSNGTINGNIITNTNGVGINFGNTYYHTITNNYLENISIYPGMKVLRDHGSSYAVINFASNSECAYNTIKNTGYNGIGFGGQNIDIHHNFVDSFCTIQSDGGAIYTFKGSLSNVIIRDNILINGIGNTPGSPSNFGAAGIYLDEESGGCEIYNNSIANTYWYGIQCNLNIGNVNFHNNTIFNGSNYQFFASYWEVLEFPVNTIVNNNLFVAKFSTQYCLGFGFANKAPYTGEEIFINNYTLNNNCYAKPIDDTYVISGNNTPYSLSNWKTYSGEDSSSYNTSQVVSTTDDIYFYYNETQINKDIALPFAMVDIYGGSQSGTITLLPFTSIVLLKA